MTSPIHPIPFVICALIVSFWAFNDFHRPFAAQQLRHSVARRRYFLGVAIYMIGMLFLYSVLVQAVLGVVHRYWPVGVEPSVTRGENPAGFASAAFSLLMLMLMPEIPLLDRLFASARQAAQALAYFPESINRLLTILSNAKFNFDEKSKSDVAAELKRFGIAGNEIAHEGYLSGAMAIAREIASIRLRIARATNDGSTFHAIRNSLLAGDFMLNDKDLAYARFLRHLANAFIVRRGLETEIGGHGDAPGALAAMVEDEGEQVVAVYRRLIAEIVLSKIWSGEGRSRFLSEFGYFVPSEMFLPFWPIALSFFIIFVSMTVQSMVLFPHAMVKMFDPHTLRGALNLIVITVNQAAIQSLAILWAVGPKKDYAFARPSLKSAPWWSYILFGLCSYVTSVILFKVIFFANPGLAWAKLGWHAYLSQSFQPLFFTVFIAALTDDHLMRRREITLRDRVRDGFILAAVSIVVQSLQSKMIIHYMNEIAQPASHSAQPTPLFNTPILWTWLHQIAPDWLERIAVMIGLSEYSLVFGVVAFIIGFTVPATASTALMRIFTIYRDEPADQKRAAPPRKAPRRARVDVASIIEYASASSGAASDMEPLEKREPYL